MISFYYNANPEHPEKDFYFVVIFNIVEDKQHVFYFEFSEKGQESMFIFADRAQEHFESLGYATARSSYIGIDPSNAIDTTGFRIFVFEEDYIPKRK